MNVGAPTPSKEKPPHHYQVNGGSMVEVPMPRELAAYGAKILRAVTEADSRGGFMSDPPKLSEVEALFAENRAEDIEQALNIKKPRKRSPDPVKLEVKQFFLALRVHQETRDKDMAKQRAYEDSVEEALDQAQAKDPETDRDTVRGVIVRALEQGSRPRRYPPVEVRSPLGAAIERVRKETGVSASTVEKAWQAWKERIESGENLGDVAETILGLFGPPLR